MTYNDIRKLYDIETANVAQFYQAKELGIDIEELDDISDEFLAIATKLLRCHDTDNKYANPSVYVSTYGKYARGSLAGTWLDLSTFDNIDKFYEFLKALHSDERDPEYMIQDYEYFCEQWYDESMGRKDFERIFAFMELDDGDRDLLQAYIEFSKDAGATIKEANNASLGRFDSDREYAEHSFRESHYIPDDLEYYIDWDAVTENEMNGVTECNGYYFL